jgi:hypothetical protein
MMRYSFELTMKGWLVGVNTLESASNFAGGREVMWGFGVPKAQYLRSSTILSDKAYIGSRSPRFELGCSLANLLRQTAPELKAGAVPCLDRLFFLFFSFSTVKHSLNP